MKNLYIPKGKILNYESLICQDIVNDGTLIVEDKIHARHISGQGVVNAGAISCRSLSASDINAAYITTDKLAAERVCASEAKVSGAAVVSCCLEAAYVVTPKLTVALYRLLKSEGYALRLAPFPVPSTRECSDFTYEDTAQDKDKKNAA